MSRSVVMWLLFAETGILPSARPDMVLPLSIGWLVAGLSLVLCWESA